jgi:acetolactate synthase-1/3 small subunit
MVGDEQAPEPETPQQTLVAYVEDKPGVLNRVASLFRRRDFNIESLNVGKSHQVGVSRLTIVMRGDDATARRFEANLYKLVNVLRVVNLTGKSTVERELALIKVASNTDVRKEILQIAEVFRARVVDMGTEAIVLEITGMPSKINGLIEVLDQFGVLETGRTGGLAMTRGAEPPPLDPQFVLAHVPASKRAQNLPSEE